MLCQISHLCTIKLILICFSLNLLPDSFQAGKKVPGILCLAGCHCFSADSLPVNAMFGMQHFQDDRPIFSLGEKRNVSYQPGALEITCHPQPVFPTMHVLIKSSHCQALFAFPSKLSPLIMSDSAWELFIYKHTISSISLSLSSLIDETLGGHGE